MSFNLALFEGSVSFYYAAGNRHSFEGTEFRRRAPFPRRTIFAVMPTITRCRSCDQPAEFLTPSCGGALTRQGSVCSSRALGAQRDPAITGRNDKGAFGGKNRSRHHAQTIAKRAAGGQAQQLRRDHRPANAEQSGDIFRRAINDEITARKSFDGDLRPVVETVVGKLFEHESR